MSDSHTNILWPSTAPWMVLTTYKVIPTQFISSWPWVSEDLVTRPAAKERLIMLESSTKAKEIPRGKSRKGNIREGKHKNWTKKGKRREERNMKNFKSMFLWDLKAPCMELWTHWTVILQVPDIETLKRNFKRVKLSISLLFMVWRTLLSSKERGTHLIWLLATPHLADSGKFESMWNHVSNKSSHENQEISILTIKSWNKV